MGARTVDRIGSGQTAANRYQPLREHVQMCRNITTLRGLEPAVTAEEIEAAARQYVRKVSGVQSTSKATEEAFEIAVNHITEATTLLLSTLPPRKQPPKSEPPLRRIARATASA